MAARPRRLAYFAIMALIVGATLLSTSLLPQPPRGVALTVGALLCATFDRVWSRVRGPVFPPPLTAAGWVYIAIVAVVLLPTLILVEFAPGSGLLTRAMSVITMLALLAGSWVPDVGPRAPSPSPRSED
ncbi:hypothetical protein A0130_16170 [Leifsonia xyli]|nr:hypothetical protein A0130_16170 [Leifsonia xyli]